mmetsp:Transcript_12402/g.19370  ORF Transcript_12402/g.19370 Transcript_12402/m.19370 type:complete len:100 (+) Transcript_12402:3043-3342(+)
MQQIQQQQIQQIPEEEDMGGYSEVQQTFDQPNDDEDNYVDLYDRKESISKKISNITKEDGGPGMSEVVEEEDENRDDDTYMNGKQLRGQTNNTIYHQES